MFVVKSYVLPRGAVDDLIYCTRPKAECISASGRPRYRGVIVWLFYKQAWYNFLLPNPFDHKWFSFSLNSISTSRKIHINCSGLLDLIKQHEASAKSYISDQVILDFVINWQSDMSSLLDCHRRMKHTYHFDNLLWKRWSKVLFC